MNRSVLVVGVAAAVAVGAAGFAACADDDDVAAVPAAEGLFIGEGPQTFEGVLVVEDGRPPQLCREAGLRLVDGAGEAMGCIGDALEVVGVDLDRVPRLSRVGTVRFAWPEIALIGTEADGVLTVTEMPPVLRVSLLEPSGGFEVHLDESGPDGLLQVSPGQDFGLIGPWQDVEDQVVEAAEGEGRLGLSEAECLDEGKTSCIGGYLLVDSAELRPGTYDFTVHGKHVVLGVESDDDPGASVTDWSTPVEPG